MFWRSVNLTGNQTVSDGPEDVSWFWRSVNLTGNQTCREHLQARVQFWRSVNLTGNQTSGSSPVASRSFGAVSI